MKRKNSLTNWRQHNSDTFIIIPRKKKSERNKTPYRISFVADYTRVKGLQIKTSPRLTKLFAICVLRCFYRYHYRHLAWCAHTQNISIVQKCVREPTSRHCCRFYRDSCRCRQRNLRLQFSWAHAIFNDIFFVFYLSACRICVCWSFEKIIFSPISCTHHCDSPTPQNGCLTFVCRGKFAAAEE